eukprot:12405818-Karenia_brevis.AAC.1
MMIIQIVEMIIIEIFWVMVLSDDAHSNSSDEDDHVDLQMKILINRIDDPSDHVDDGGCSYL